MGFDFIKKHEVFSEKDMNLLEEICIKNNVSVNVVENLLVDEELYQLMERRHGIYESLKRVLEAGDK